jgi:trans-aconitate 2-methyltransferase
VSWDPAQYLKFSGERMRPAVDLLARIEAPAPAVVADLGCGAGNLAPLLQARWPQARITGVDSSPEMLVRARKDHPAVEFVLADVHRWRPSAPVDVLYSNAALHWIEGHAELLVRLLTEGLSPGGTLAVQMPRNFGAPSHTAIVETIEQGPWRARLEPVLRREPVAAPGVYWRLLEGRAAALQIWETEYLQVLSGPDAVAEYTKGTWLKQFLDRLDGDARTAFEADYRARVRPHYPPEPDGRTLFPFRRLFIVARRAA